MKNKSIVIPCVIVTVLVSKWCLYNTVHSARRWSGKWQLSAPAAHCPCNERQHPGSFVHEQSFYALDSSVGAGGRPCALVYSAFFDPRDQAVKVVSDSDMSCFRSIDVTCQIWYSSFSVPYISPLWFHHHMLEKETGHRIGVVYSCAASPNASLERPYAVSFFANDDYCMCLPMMSMRIHQPRPPFYKFSACIAPLFGNISAENLGAFIELHRFLGAEKFYFYTESVSQQVDKLLQSYQRKGVAEVLSWRSWYPELLTYHNQQAMQEDCSLRNLQQSTWVAQFDVDEVIMPANGLHWGQMVAKFESNDTGVFTVLNRDYTTDESVTCDDLSGGSAVSTSVRVSKSLSSGSSTPMYFRRLSYQDVSYSAGQRSKILYSPQKTAEARTHYALLLPGFREVVLTYDQAVLKHYRNQPRSSSTTFIRDTSFCAYKDLLIPRLNQKWN